MFPLFYLISRVNYFLRQKELTIENTKPQSNNDALIGFVLYNYATCQYHYLSAKGIVVRIIFY